MITNKSPHFEGIKINRGVKLEPEIPPKRNAATEHLAKNQKN